MYTGGDHRRWSHKVYTGEVKKGLLSQLTLVTQSGWEGWRAGGIVCTKAGSWEGGSQGLGELKATQAEYRGMVDEATKVVFHGKESGLYPADSGEAQRVL